MAKNQSTEALAEACEDVGGQKALADLIGTSQSQVSFWMNDAKKGVPAEFCDKIEVATNQKVRRHALRPDVFSAPLDAKESAA